MAVYTSAKSLSSITGYSPLFSKQEREFGLNCLKEGFRLDGRGTYDMRPLEITLGASSLGHADVSLGKTRVVAQVSGDIVRPNARNPTEGILNFFIDFSPMASSEFEPGRMSSAEVYISRLLEKALRKSKAVDVEGLCILAGEKVWSIRVDIRILDHDGNMTDCACIAAVTALLHYKRPDVTVVGDQVTLHSLEDKNPVPLSIHHIPICCTFAFFEQGDLMVLDPCLLEEKIQQGEMTLVMNVHKELCTLSKSGGTPLDPSQLVRCSQIALVKATELTNLIRTLVYKKDS